MYKNKTAVMIALIMMFAMAVSIVALPLPTTYAQSTDDYSGSYYSWPVDDQLTDWQEAYLAELNDGPLSAHVRWVQPFAPGGVVGGGISGQHAFDIGDAYAGKWGSASIVGGIAYWTFDAPNQSPTVYVATDIRTGEELWRDSRLGGSPFDQVIVTDHGIDAYLWRSSGGTYSAYDPWTCQWVYDITDIPSGTRTTGEKGEFIIYSLSTTGGYMRYWNQLWMLEQPGVIETLARERSINATEIGWTAEWTIPEGLPGQAREYRWGDRVIGTDENTPQGNTTMWAFSLEPGKEGTLLYNTDAHYELADVEDGPSASVSQRLFGDSPEDSSHLHWNSDTMRFWAYSYGTGEELWKSDDFDMEGGFGGEHYLNQYVGTSSTVGRLVQPNYYRTGVSGMVYCYNATKGLIWIYHATDPYSEILWANDWWQGTPFAIAGKIYFGHLEHSPVDPLPRGAPFFCLNATTGEEIWRVDGMYRQSGWGGQPLVGSGIILTQDTYDQRTYCVGKGPTATTVTAPDVAVPFGATAIIRGTVMDISPGCSGIKVQLRFPHGVPAVSEESMSEWMTYVYKQFARPADAVGVNVSLTVLDSNNQAYDTAIVTSDANGYFSYEFAAENAGEYTVKVSFEGSNSYYGSFAVSDPFVVEEAPEPTPEPTPTPASVADMYFVPAVAGIIVALVVVGAVLVLLLLKRR
jgi:hypothetical protein